MSVQYSLSASSIQKTYRCYSFLMNCAMRNIITLLEFTFFFRWVNHHTIF